MRVAVKLRNRIDMAIGYHLAPTNDPAHNGEQALIRQIAPHIGRFIDVGANIGYWTLGLLEAAPDAAGMAVEPGAAALEELRKKLPPQIEVIAAAVGDVPGTMPFFEQASAGELSSLVASHAGKAVRRDVEVVTVDGLLGRVGWDRVDLLKIDTEGFDGRVIRGAAESLERQAIGVVQFEYNRPWRDAGSTLADTVGLLAGFGYEVRVVRPAGTERYDYSRFGEFFQYANFVAVAPHAQGWF